MAGITSKYRKILKGETVKGILFVLPFAGVWGVFQAWPVIYGFYISLFRWQPLLGSEFVGVGNYAHLLRDDRFWNALKNTFWFAGLTLPMILALGLLFALALFGLTGHKGIGIVESTLFWPYLLNVAIVSIIWRWLLDPDFGLVLAYLRGLGLRPPVFLNDPTWALPAIAGATAWWLAGYRMVVFRAAMEDIPETVYELAKLDGVPPWTFVFRILLPLLKPALLFAFVLTAISSFRVLGQVLIMTAGGPGRASDVLALYLYEAGWQFFEMGYAAAIGFVLFLLIFLVTLVGLRFFGLGSELGEK
ncbi:MAG: sugar ABC transporter permease [Chloroflexi bacterium]|nr:sugar ABC transporter permease [Chloroflexota bacterium]